MVIFLLLNLNRSLGFPRFERQREILYFLQYKKESLGSVEILVGLGGWKRRFLRGVSTFSFHFFVVGNFVCDDMPCRRTAGGRARLGDCSIRRPVRKNSRYFRKNNPYFRKNSQYFRFFKPTDCFGALLILSVLFGAAVSKIR